VIFVKAPIAHHDSQQLPACDEDAYRILIAPGQAVSGVEDQALRGAGKSRVVVAAADWLYRTEHVTAAAATDGVYPARTPCCRREWSILCNRFPLPTRPSRLLSTPPNQPRFRILYASSSQADTAAWEYPDVPGYAPITSRDAPKLPQRIPRFIPDHELDLVMPIINAITCPFQRAALLVARWSGARRDEIRPVTNDLAETGVKGVQPRGAQKPPSVDLVA
jgi:hypothetical protein